MQRIPGWLIALLLIVAFAFQGTRGIWEPDEGRYSSAGINMQESGNWLVPTVDGEHPHLTKPPMVYWVLAASFALLGHNEWAARLPGALAFVGTGLLVFGIGRRLLPSKPWLPATVWALSFAPAIAANVISTDPLLALFETLAMYGFVEAWSRGGRPARPWYVLMWVGFGLAFLTKGPPGLLPLGAMVAMLAFHDRTRLVAMFVPAGLLLFAVVAFTWFGLVIAQQPDRLRYFMGYEVYDRVFTSTHDRNSQWYGAFVIYLPVLVVGTLPWAVPALIAAGGPRRVWARLRQRSATRDGGWLLLLYWLLVPLAVFFLARSRLQLYILPLFVPLALVMARPLATWPALRGERMGWMIVLTATALVALKATLAYWPSDRDARRISAELTSVIQPYEIDEIVFVGMRPFYGLNVYLDKKIEGIQIGERRFDYSKFVAEDDVCDEISEHERNVYAIKRHHAGRFIAAVTACGSRSTEIGAVHADDYEIPIFLVTPPAP